MPAKKPKSLTNNQNRRQQRKLLGVIQHFHERTRHYLGTDSTEWSQSLAAHSQPPSDVSAAQPPPSRQTDDQTIHHLPRSANNLDPIPLGSIIHSLHHERLVLPEECLAARQNSGASSGKASPEALLQERPRDRSPSVSPFSIHRSDRHPSTMFDATVPVGYCCSLSMPRHQRRVCSPAVPRHPNQS